MKRRGSSPLAALVSGLAAPPLQRPSLMHVVLTRDHAGLEAFEIRALAADGAPVGRVTFPTYMIDSVLEEIGRVRETVVRVSGSGSTGIDGAPEAARRARRR